jgi:hypothetical protein
LAGNLGFNSNVVHLSFVKEAVHCSTLEPLHALPLALLGDRGGVNLNLPPSPPWGRGWSRLAGPGEGVTPERIEKDFPEHPLCEQYWV